MEVFIQILWSQLSWWETLQFRSYYNWFVHFHGIFINDYVACFQNENLQYNHNWTWFRQNVQDVCDLMTASNDSVRMTKSSQEAYPPILCPSGDVIFHLMHLLLVTKHIISHETARRWFNFFGPYIYKQIQVHPYYWHHLYPSSIKNCGKAKGSICL